MRAPIRREDARLAAERYRHEERTRFVRHVEPLRFRPENRAMLHMIRIVPGTYYYRRNMFYDTYAWGPPPYVYNLAPRYGLFDAVFLAFMVDHVAEREYALMYYNHQNDEAFVQWRQQMDQMAADNAGAESEAGDDGPASGAAPEPGDAPVPELCTGVGAGRGPVLGRDRPVDSASASAVGQSLGLSAPSTGKAGGASPSARRIRLL